MEFFLGHFLFSLEVILSEVAVLAKATGVVRLVGVLTLCCHLGLTLAVVTCKAHVLGILSLVVVGTYRLLLLLMLS